MNVPPGITIQPAMRLVHFLPVAALAILSLMDRPAVAAPVSFVKDVAPIFAAKCLTCHGPEKAKGHYRLDTFEALMKSGDSEKKPVVASQPDQSHLLQLITTKDADDRMPQKDDPLPAATVALIRRWIQEGARFDGADQKASLSSLLAPAAHPEPPVRYARPVPVLAVAFGRDGAEVFAGGYHEVTVWNSTNGALLRRIKNLPQQVRSLAMSPDGNTLAVAGGASGRSGEVKLIDPVSGTITRTLVTTPDMMLALAFSSDGLRLACGGTDNSIRVFDVAGGKQELRVEAHADWVLDVAFSHDGKLLASASRDKTARILELKSGESEQTYAGHGEPVFTVAFTAADKRILSTARDRGLHFWSVSEAKKLGEAGGFEGEALRLIVSGTKAFTAGADGRVRPFNVGEKKPEPLAVLEGHRDAVYGLALHESSHRLVSSSYDGEVRVWDTESGKLVTNWVAAPGYPVRSW